MLFRSLQTFGQTVSDLGSTLSKVSDDLSSSQAVTQMLANERESARGVSIDDELTDLQRYQQACADSAAMHTTLNEMPPMR